MWLKWKNWKFLARSALASTDFQSFYVKLHIFWGPGSIPALKNDLRTFLLPIWAPIQISFKFGRSNAFRGAPRSNLLRNTPKYTKMIQNRLRTTFFNGGVKSEWGPVNVLPKNRFSRLDTFAKKNFWFSKNLFTENLHPTWVLWCTQFEVHWPSQYLARAIWNFFSNLVKNDEKYAFWSYALIFAQKRKRFSWSFSPSCQLPKTDLTSKNIFLVPLPLFKFLATSTLKQRKNGQKLNKNAH